MPTNRLLCLCCVLAVSAQTARAQQAAPGGDPLPPGAFARLGSTRFRVTGPVFGARFVAGGKQLLLRIQKESTLASDNSGALRLLDAESGRELGRMPLEMDHILSHYGSSLPVKEGISFPAWCISPDGRLVADASFWRDWRVRVRELLTGKTLAELAVKGRRVTHLQFSPDGARLAAVAQAADDKTDQQALVVIQVWDLQSRKVVRTLTPPPRPRESFQAQCLLFSPDGAYLAATGYEDGKAGVARVWDLARGGPSWRLPGETAKRGLARALAISPDSKHLAAAHDGKLRLWDLASGKQVREVARYDEHCATLDFSPDGKRLLAGAGQGAAVPNRVRMWDLDGGREVSLPVSAPHGYVFSRDGATLVLADAERNSLVVCEAATGRVRYAVRVSSPKAALDYLEHRYYKARQGMGWPVALSPDGKTLVAADRAGPLRRFDLTTGKEIPGPGVPTEPAAALAFTPDGSKLLAAEPGRVLLHDLSGAAPPLALRRRRGPQAQPGAAGTPKGAQVAVSPDGRWAAAGWDDGAVSVWDPATGRLLWQADGHESGVSSVAFAPGGATLLSAGSYDGRLQCWDAATGRKGRALEADVDKQVFSRRRLVPGVTARTAFCIGERDWQEQELPTGGVRRTLKAPGTAEAFSADGVFALVSAACSYHLLDLRTWQERRGFAYVDGERALHNPGARACFSADGRLVAGVAGNGVVRVWDRGTGTVLATLAGHDGGALAVAFAPDGKALATSAGDGTILLWRAPAPLRATVPARPPRAARVRTGGQDRDGEPLPAGARERLGLLRFQYGARVTALRYSADGSSILVRTASPEKGGAWIDLNLWDSRTGKLRHRLEVTYAYHGPIAGQPHIDDWAVSADTRLLATCNTYLGRDVPGTFPGLRVRDTRTGKVVYESADAKGRGPYGRFAPDSRTLLELGNLRLIDLRTGEARALDRGGRKIEARDADFSADGKILLVHDYSGTMDWWDLSPGGKTGRLTQRLEYGTRPAVAPDSRHVALVTAEEKDKPSRLVVVDIRAGKTVRDFGEIAGPVEQILYSPDGTQLLAVATDGLARWGVKGGKQVWEPSRQLLRRWELATGRELPAIRGTDGLAVQFSPDGRLLAVATAGQVRLHDWPAARELRRFPLGAKLVTSELFRLRSEHYFGHPFAFSPDGSRLAVAAGRTLRQFETATGKEIGPTPNARTMFALAVAEGGRRVAACAPEEVLVWQAGKQLPALRVQPWAGADGKPVTLTCVALSPDGSRLAVGGADGEIGLFDLPSGRPARRLRGHAAPVTDLRLAPDGATLHSADLRSGVISWDLRSGKAVRKAAGPGSVPRRGPWRVVEDDGGVPVLHGPDGERHDRTAWPFLGPGGAVCSPADDGFRLREPGAPGVRVVENAGSLLCPATASPDGRLLASPSSLRSRWLDEECLVRLVDLRTGREVRALTAPLAPAGCCFSPDGRLLAAGGDRGLRLWDTARGTPRASFDGHRGRVSAVAFSPDGATLVSAAFDGTLLVWDVATLLARSSEVRAPP